MRRRLLALALAWPLAGCSTGDPLTNDLLTQSIATGGQRKSVCAISGIGDTFSIQKVGVTVFGNALDMAPIDAWGIDDFVTGRIAAQLNQRFEVKRVAYPKGAFAPLDKPKSPFAEPKDDRKDIVRGIAGGKNCGFVVAVTKSASQIGSSNQHVVGLGVVEAGGLLYPDNVWLFALSEIRVYDGQTFAVLGHKRSYTWQPSLGGEVIRGPSRKVGKAGWPASPAQVASDARLKQATMELLDQSMGNMIAELFPEAQASARR
jgi:hypothetical protein